MRKISIILTALLFISVMNAQDLKVIKLNAPDKARGTAVMKAFSPVIPTANMQRKN